MLCFFAFFLQMVRKITNSDKIKFSGYYSSHTEIEKFDLDQPEFTEVCKALRWRPIQKNVDNINYMVIQYKSGAYQHCEELSASKNDPENDSCGCNICLERLKWDGKHIYNFNNFTYSTIGEIVIPEKQWNEFKTVDKRGMLKLSNGYGGYVTSAFRAKRFQCGFVACNNNYFVKSVEHLIIQVYCTSGTSEPCNLYKLVHDTNTPDRPDGAKLFIVHSTSLPLKHCVHSVPKAAQVRGWMKRLHEEALEKKMPKAHVDDLINKYGDTSPTTPGELWPVSEPVAQKIRANRINRKCSGLGPIADLIDLWKEELGYPRIRQNSSSSFR